MKRTASEYRAEAAAKREQSRESFERCDTDGFLSQWASDISARLLDTKATLAEDDWKSSFPGLYEGNRRVKAKRFTKVFDGYRSVTSWLLHDDEQELFLRRGKRFIPTGDHSRIQKQLGLREALEDDSADAKLDGGGTGLSGCAGVYVSVYRDGDPWGADATICEGNEV